METRLIISFSVAAVLHASVLFGVRWPKAVVPAAPTFISIDTTPAFPADEPEPVVPEDQQPAPRGSPDARPQSDDVIVRDALAFQQVVAPTPPHVAPSPITTIPVEPFGRPDGDLNARHGIGPVIVNIAALDNQPRTRSQVPPVYPADAKNDGATAEVMVEFVVDESGRVVSPRVVRSTDPRFDSATLKAVARWRFEPGKLNGRAVKFRMMAPVVFSLDA